MKYMAKEINKENLEAIGFHLDEKMTEMLKSNIDSHYEYYVAHNRRYILQSSVNNMTLENGWGMESACRQFRYELNCIL